MQQNKKLPLWQSEHFQENEGVLEGIVPEDLVYLKDHFAEFPLVPGVIELQWAVDFIPCLIGCESVEIEKIQKLKYQKFLRPNDRFVLKLKWQAEKQQVLFELKTAGENCASGTIKVNVLC